VSNGQHFDRVAATYDRGRPPYPARVFDLLTELGVLAPGVRLLEIGAGSGQATRVLVEQGATVDAVEPGPDLAGMLRERLAGRAVRVLEATVEDVPLAEASYDAAVAATSLHWVDLDRVLPRLHSAIRPGGWLVPWWTVFGDGERPTPFRARVDALAIATGLGGPDPVSAAKYDELCASLARGGRFEAPVPEVIRWSTVLDTDGVRDLFTTFPTWAAVPGLVDRVAGFVDDVGGSVEEHYLTVVYPSRRSG
jgi:SAM-dependent methyltransferase